MRDVITPTPHRVHKIRLQNCTPDWVVLHFRAVFGSGWSVQTSSSDIFRSVEYSYVSAAHLAKEKNPTSNVLGTAALLVGPSLHSLYFICFV